MSNTPFPRDTHLSNIAVAYRNPDATLIADQVLPRVAVGKKAFSWQYFPPDQSFKIPETEVDEYGEVKMSRLQGTKLTDRCVDQAWIIPLSKDDISEAPPEYKPEELATAEATNYIQMRREVRVANLVFDASKYGANQVTVAAGDKFGNTNSNPLKYIRNYMRQCFIRPNVLVFGALAWNEFSAHPKVVSACLGNDGTNGFATRARVAELLEVAEVLVGEAIIDAAKPGKAAAMANAWGPHLAAIYRNRAASTTGGVTFGMTAEFRKRQAGAQDIKLGVAGGRAVQVYETVKELIVAPGAGFFFQGTI